jgi:hypothetical protein
MGMSWEQNKGMMQQQEMALHVHQQLLHLQQQQQLQQHVAAR